MASKPPKTANQKPLQPSNALTELIALLDIEQLEVNLFRGMSTRNSWGRVYGGQVLAQAVVAATRTTPTERTLHSLHSYFLLAGDPKKPIVYDVEKLRDGGSFSTRRVTAIQDGHPMFSMIASFHITEPGFEHHAPMPSVPGPETLRPLGEVLSDPNAKVPDTMRAYYSRERPFDVRIVETDRYFGAPHQAPHQHLWMKSHGALPDDPVLHSAMLIFASDFAMIDTALIAHGKMMFDPAMQLASLDHALWMHRPVRVDDWFLYAIQSPETGGGRGLAHGTFYDKSGAMIASVAQEGLMRARSTAFVIK